MQHHFHREIVPQSCKPSAQEIFPSEVACVSLTAILKSFCFSPFKALFNARLLSLTFTENMETRWFFLESLREVDTYLLFICFRRKMWLVGTDQQTKLYLSSLPQFFVCLYEELSYCFLLLSIAFSIVFSIAFFYGSCKT